MPTPAEASSVCTDQTRKGTESTKKSKKSRHIILSLMHILYSRCEMCKCDPHPGVWEATRAPLRSRDRGDVVAILRRLIPSILPPAPSAKSQGFGGQRPQMDKTE